MGPFKNALRLLVVLTAGAVLLARPGRPGGGDGRGDGTPNRRPGRGGGGSQSIGDLQRNSRDAAQRLGQSGQGDGANPNQRRPDGDDSSTLPRDENGRPVVDRRDPDQLRELFDQRDETGRIPQDQLPEGWGYRKDGILHDENGYPVGHPDRPKSLRDEYFPSGFSQNTHNEMVRQYTGEGGQPNGTTGTIPADPQRNQSAVDYTVRDGIPVDNATGRPVPRDRLTWYDDKGNEIPYYRTNSEGREVTNLTYDHRTPVVEYWNTDGYRQSWGDRQAWYDNPSNLVPMGGPENSSKSGTGSDGGTYRYADQPPLGPPYGEFTPKGTR